MKRERTLVFLLLFLGFLIASRLHLLRFIAFSPGYLVFGPLDHADGITFMLGVALDLGFYAIILYGMTCAITWLIKKSKP